MTDGWTRIAQEPPDDLFDVVVSKNGTRQANLILWRTDGTRHDFKKGYAIKYPDGKIWWPEHTTHWRLYLAPPEDGT